MPYEKLLYQYVRSLHFLSIAADIISCVEFNHDGDLLATGDKGGRVVIFQRDPVVSTIFPRDISSNVLQDFF